MTRQVTTPPPPSFDISPLVDGGDNEVCPCFNCCLRQLVGKAGFLVHALPGLAYLITGCLQFTPGNSRTL